MVARAPADLPAPFDQLPRPELTARLREGLDRGAVLVVAGPGFGKTTAVTAAVNGSGRPVARVRCRAGDRDARRLVLAIVAALRTAVPGAVDVLEEEILAGGGRVDALGVERWLLGELDALLVEPVVLVVDDAESLAGADEALALLRDLALSPSIRLALLSRVELGLRLGKARASGTVTRIDETELAFDAEETAALLEARAGVAPSPAEVERTLARTRGWPLGVALGLATGSPLRAFFLEEVLDPLAPDVREALLDVALADPPAASPPPAPALRPFIASAPDTAAGWTLHPLLAEFLVERGELERDAEARAAAWRRVAEALTATGRREEAIDAWLRGDAWERAREELLSDPPALLQTTPDVIARWARTVPAGAEDALALLLSGLDRFNAGEMAEAIPLLRVAARDFAMLGVPDADWTARSVLAQALYYRGHFAELGALASSPRGGRDEPVALTTAWVAIGLAAQGRLAEARTMLEPEDGRRVALTPDLEALVVTYLADPSGDIDDALERLGRTEERMRLRGEDVLLRAVLVASQTAGMQTSAGRPAEALNAIELGGRVADDDRALPFMRSRLRSMRALLLAQLGRFDEADAVLGTLEAGDADPGERLTRLARATIAAGRGNGDTALREVDAALALSREAALQFRHLEGALAVGVLATAGSPERASALIEELLDDLDRRLPGTDGRFYRGRLLALRAAVGAERSPAAARADLAAAFEHAGPAGHHVIRAAWPLLEPVLGALLDDEAFAVEPVLAALDRAFPDHDVLAPFAAHAAPAVRIAVAEMAAERERRLPALDFRVLGGFALHRAGRPVDEAAWDRPMAARLVRFLLARRGAPVPDDLLLEAFWPDRPAKAARSSLQVTVSRARAVLDPPDAEESLIVSSQRTYRLALREQDRVDADVFEHAAAAALAATGPDRGRLLEAAADLWTGPVLPEERYADWAADWREHLEQRLRRVLVALVEVRTAENAHDAAIDAALRLLELDPTDEGTHRRLIAAYARAGRRGHALRQYLVCRAALVEELGLEPSDGTTDLQRRVLAGLPV